jgi:succinate dehydrogenase / fumarate reductase, membrane anchor subunit
MDKKKRSSWGWFWQSVTGILLILLLGLHMIAHHFVVEGGLRDFNQVIEYLSNPIIIITELAFLISVTVHAMLGMRSILFDLGLSPQMERVVTYASVVVGVLTVLYGFWLTYTILAQGSAPTAFLFR